MKRLMISAFGAVVLLAAATTMLRSHTATPGGLVAASGTISLQALQAGVDVNKLPVEKFEDLSFVN